MISIRWRCDECGETEIVENDDFATIEKIIQDVMNAHEEISPRCIGQEILVGFPTRLLDPDRGYAMRHENGHSNEEIPVEGED